MDLPIRLDPSEVLEHLKQLGYSGITPQQLKAFMNDLKKLILHEQTMSSSISLSSTDTSNSTLSSSSPHLSDLSYSSSSCVSKEQGISLSGTTSSSASEPCSSYERAYSGKENSNKQKKSWSASSSDLKPKSSFIRPWNLGSKPPRSARSDPVSLYHHYKTLWDQQKFPGENDHADLRWLIRERMMGQDPNVPSQSVLRQASKNFRL